MLGAGCTAGLRRNEGTRRTGFSDSHPTVSPTVSAIGRDEYPSSRRAFSPRTVELPRPRIPAAVRTIRRTAASGTSAPGRMYVSPRIPFSAEDHAPGDVAGIDKIEVPVDNDVQARLHPFPDETEQGRAAPGVVRPNDSRGADDNRIQASGHFLEHGE